MTPAARRRHDLDWLRIGATFLLFPFHVAKTFDVLPIQLHASIAAKVALLLPVAVVSTMTVYHVLVRPTPVLGPLFGMRPRRSASAAGVTARPA